MKIFCLILNIVIIAIITIFIASCNVTETPNPCPSGGCAPSEAGPSNTYENDAFGVTIKYPEGWTYTEASDGASLIFESEGPEVTTAVVSFERLSPKPASLFEYLSDTYPERTFTNYSTMTLVGYTYDDPTAGANGGDLREYFFLNGDLLVHVTAEIFLSGRVDLGSLLNGISFY